jgi:hypothetical protein
LRGWVGGSARAIGLLQLRNALGQDTLSKSGSGPEAEITALKSQAHFARQPIRRLMVILVSECYLQLLSEKDLQH